MPRYVDVDNIGSFMVCAFPDDEYAIGWNEAIAKIETSAPTADVEPIVHAHWRYMGMTHDGLYIYACLECGRRIFIASSSSLKYYPYCHCGARMDEEVRDK